MENLLDIAYKAMDEKQAYDLVVLDLLIIIYIQLPKKSLIGGSAYHHLNNYGTTSMMYHIGTIKKKNILQKNGKVKTIDVVDVTITVDERIADGLYLVKSIKLLENILQNPEVLDKELCEEYISQNIK